MIVKNRRTQKEYTITKEDYAKLVDKKIHKSFIVVSDQDSEPKKIIIPKQIEEYQRIPKDLKIKKSEPKTETND